MLNSKRKDQLPPRYATVDYSKDVPENIKTNVREMMSGGQSVYLYGKSGIGKTHLAHAIYAQCLKTKRAAKLYNMPELLDVIRKNYDTNNHGEDLLDLIEYDGLLILDDVGAEKISEWVEETFYKIINRRYEQMLPTFITSNFSLSELSERLDDRIPSRIQEMCRVVRLDGEDRRHNKNHHSPTELRQAAETLREQEVEQAWTKEDSERALKKLAEIRDSVSFLAKSKTITQEEGEKENIKHAELDLERLEIINQEKLDRGEEI